MNEDPSNMILGPMSMSWSASPILRKKYQSLPVHTVRSDLLRDMVKTLQDCCLACIARHISSYNRLGTFLSRLHKESLLERMCWHGQLTPERSPSVSYHLFSHVLKRVNLSYSTQVDDKTLDVLARSDCLPTSITVKDCPNVTDKGIASLAHILHETETLNLQKLKHITSEGVKPLASKTLKSVSLKQTSAITDPGVIALVKNCPNIENLNLTELHKLTDAAFIQIAETLQDKLVELDASEVNLITSAGTQALAKHCKNLSMAAFESGVKLDGTGLIQMAEQCNLSSLSISFCYKVTSQQIEILVSLLRARGSLHTFEAMGVTVSPLALEMLASTSCLTHLSLCGVQVVNDEMVEMITASAGQTLLNLDVSNCLSLTDQCCTSIAHNCKVLEVLGLTNLKEIKGDDLCRFFHNEERAKQFRAIMLSGSKNLLPSVVETIVTHCPNLETITMAGLKDITDDIAVAIAHHCPNIQQISFRNCNLTDAGVCEIAIHCPQLQMIALAGIHILTDKCVLALAENCPYIREVYLSGCAKITKQAITYLKDCAVNRVFVNHSTPNAPFGLLMAKDLDTGEYTRVDDMEFDSLLIKARARTRKK